MAQELNVKISGMHCGACVNRVTQALKKVPGVAVEDVQVGSAKVSYEPDQAGTDQIRAAIEKIGFAVEKG
jgi:copper chaperone